MSSTAAARVPTRPIARPASRERQQPRLRVVAPAPRRSAGGLALLSVGLLGLGLLVLLLLNISIGKDAFALTELQRQQRQLAEDRQSLAEQVEAAGAPDKLAARAAKLGMVPAPNTAFVRLPDGSLQGKPVIAEAPVKKVDPNAKAGSAGTGGTAGGRSASKPVAGKQTPGKQTSGKQTSGKTSGKQAASNNAETTAESTP